MKTIEELFNEVMSDKSLRTELIKAIKAGKQEGAQLQRHDPGSPCVREAQDRFRGAYHSG